MAVPKKFFSCNKCNFKSPRWLGKCTDCGAWNSMIEGFSINENNPLEKKNISMVTDKHGNTQNIARVETIANVLENIKNQEEDRIYLFSATNLNSFWGGGLVAGSMTLLAGEPGLGKSTFALQILRSLTNGSKTALRNDKNNDLSLLYITAEESVGELARRAERLEIPQQILTYQANNFDLIEKTIKSTRPNVVIIDSIQTIYTSEITSSPGSIAQVSTLTNQFLAIAKSYNISIILIGHVTKEGQIAGPKTLEHMVDSVLLLESSDSSQYRTLSFSKNRFGNTNDLLLLKMEESGLTIITDPSLALLENIESGIGICYGIALQKKVPFIVEIQALVSLPSSAGFGRRDSFGLKSNRLNIILAIAEKYLGLTLKDRDIYVQITGSPKAIEDESLDLPIILAILSSLFDIKTMEIFEKKGKMIEKHENSMQIENDSANKSKKEKITKAVYCGRLTLSGKIRIPTSEKERKNIALKLGFKYNEKVSFDDIYKVIKL